MHCNLRFTGIHWKEFNYRNELEIIYEINALKIFLQLEWIGNYLI